jgi:hypothetical protein
MNRVALVSLLGTIGVLCVASSPATREPEARWEPEFYVDMPVWVPRLIDMGTKRGIPDLQDGAKCYLGSYREGWNDRLAGRHAEYRPLIGDPATAGVFSTDLDIPFRQETGFSHDARHAGYAACDRALRGSWKR